MLSCLRLQIFRRPPRPTNNKWSFPSATPISFRDVAKPPLRKRDLPGFRTWAEVTSQRAANPELGPTSGAFCLFG
jgi:hypothetical protein